MKDMFKYSYKFIFFVLLLISFGCKKDGVYSPMKKIVAIYTQENGGDKKLESAWTWERNKLMQIEYPAQHKTATFVYEKGVVAKVMLDDGVKESHISFQYDKNRYVKMNFYEGNTMLISYRFFYDNKKVSKITVVEYANTSGGYEEEKRWMSELFPVMELAELSVLTELSELTTSLQAAAKRSSERKNGGEIEPAETKDLYTIAFSWVENNIQQISFEYMHIPIHIRYAYDAKKNPFQGMFDTSMENEIVSGGYDITSNNKNNIVKMQITVGANDIPYLDTETDYQYKHKFPIEGKTVRNYADFPNLSKTITTFYEYK